MQNQTTDALQRKRDRIYRACVECRSSKTKCNGLKPSCARCQQRKIKCVYEHSSQSLPAWAQRLSIHATESTSSVALARDEAGDIETTAVMHSDMRRSTSPNPPLQESAASVVDDQTSLSWYYPSLYFLQNIRVLNNPRLTSPTLPGAEQTRLLAEQYFNNIHPLRCFAFIHKPSFLQNMESKSLPRERNALLHVICALGAQ